MNLEFGIASPQPDVGQRRLVGRTALEPGKITPDRFPTRRIQTGSWRGSLPARPPRKVPLGR